MCGRYANAQAKNELARRYEIDQLSLVLPEPSFNIKPTDQVPIVLESHKIRGERRLESARWSLIPPWSKEAVVSFPTFNARVETAAEKPSFKGSVRNRRCILPATGYYEWHTVEKIKTPYFITPASRTEADTVPYRNGSEPSEAEKPLIHLAGLYSWWKNPDPEAVTNGGSPWVLSATILTRASAGKLANIHDRMPMMVPENLIDPWLDPRVLGSQSFLEDFAAGTLSVTNALDFYPVAPLSGDGPMLIEPLKTSETGERL